ncbi:MAG: arginine N-succinyltransferase, partial [Sphingomonadaceae bacterium]
SEWPFYSYRLTTLTQVSRELGRTFSAEMLTLVTDLEGSSEVGGLFLHPGERAGGLGLLLARSRYLFMRRHRERIADLTIAELRGVIDEAGSSPFWDALAGRFFDMSFQEADEFNAIHGNQFIADLMPKSPVYLALLPDSARGVIGRCHPTGKAALRMLRQEGFEYEDYIDIFDGGPTVIARTDRIRTIEMARGSRIAAIEGGGEKAIVAHGRLNGFRAGYARLAPRADGETAIDGEAAEALGLGVGDEILHVPRSLG